MKEREYSMFIFLQMNIELNSSLITIKSLIIKIVLYLDIEHSFGIRHSLSLLRLRRLFVILFFLLADA
jgi:hypothetical protein